MSEKASIYIEGIVYGEDESKIITNAIGQYSKRDGVHILRYPESAVMKEEKIENENEGIIDRDENCTNTIKISPGFVEMIKIGENSTHMIFDLDMSTQSIYDTPYGSLCFLIQTRRIDIVERANEVVLHMEYSLSHNNNHISDNSIHIIIKT
jgi:uncharacterized beta-barrel protein YwiB (DUF1934 family)